jgi:hypothetical protein
MCPCATSLGMRCLAARGPALVRAHPAPPTPFRAAAECMGTPEVDSLLKSIAQLQKPKRHDQKSRGPDPFGIRASEDRAGRAFKRFPLPNATKPGCRCRKPPSRWSSAGRLRRRSAAPSTRRAGPQWSSRCNGSCGNEARSSQHFLPRSLRRPLRFDLSGTVKTLYSSVNTFARVWHETVASDT